MTTNSKPGQELVPRSRLKHPVEDLSDVGGYCFMSLTSVALNMLYREDGEGVHCNKKFVDQFVKSLAAHLRQPDKVVETALMVASSVEIQLYQPFIDSLKKEAVATTEGLSVFPKDLVIVGLQEGCYDARLRTLAKFMCLLLKVDWSEVEAFEDSVLKSFQEEEHVETEEEKKEKASKDKMRKIRKVALIGAATVGGGVLVGLTGGLAAPFIAAGAGAVIGGAGAAALGSTAGIAIIGSLFGAAGAGLGGYKMKKRVGDVEEFTFEPLTEGSQLHLTIAVTGWITDECPDFSFAWRGLANSDEQFVLRYESKYLKQMGSAMDYLLSFAVSQATSEALKYTVLSSLMAAIIWPATILAASSVIDNPWSMMTSRTVQAGKMLADVLLSRQQGKRPVTLIGFSLGARVIFYCLQEMSKRKNSEGIIEDAVMLGTPATANPADWKAFSRVVAGKLVNGYCRGDWLLKFLYRTASVQFSIAGLEPIKWTDRRMHNIDLSEIVEGHMDYMQKLDQILEIVGIRTKPRATGGTRNNLKEWVAVNKVKTGISPSSSASSGLQGLPEHAQEAGESMEDQTQGMADHSQGMADHMKNKAESAGTAENMADTTNSKANHSQNMAAQIQNRTVQASSSVLTEPENVAESTEQLRQVGSVNHNDVIGKEALKVTKDGSGGSVNSHATEEQLKDIADREKGLKGLDPADVEIQVLEEKALMKDTSFNDSRNNNNTSEQGKLAKVIDSVSLDHGKGYDGKEDSRGNNPKMKASVEETVAEGLVSDAMMDITDKLSAGVVIKDKITLNEKKICHNNKDTSEACQSDVAPADEFGEGSAVVKPSADSKESFREAGTLKVTQEGQIIASSYPSSDSGFDSLATQDDVGSPQKCAD